MMNFNFKLPEKFNIEQHFIDNDIPFKRVAPGQGGIFIKQEDGSLTKMTDSVFADPRLTELFKYEELQKAQVVDLQGAMLVIKDVGDPVDQLMYSKLCLSCAGANNEIEMMANMRIAKLMDTYIMELANELLERKYDAINMDILLFIHSTQYAQDK